MIASKVLAMSVLILLLLPGVSAFEGFRIDGHGMEWARLRWNASGSEIIEAQYSADNSTWFNVSIISQANRTALQAGLEQDTVYSFQGRNQTSGWTNTSQRTKEGLDSMMNLTVMLFLSMINLVVFILPFYIKIQGQNISEYILKRMVWIASVLLLWFNITILRQMASDKALGLDLQLEVYWWVLTWGAFICVFAMCYFMVAGSLKMMKEATMKKRMGYDEGQD